MDVSGRLVQERTTLGLVFASIFLSSVIAVLYLPQLIDSSAENPSLIIFPYPFPLLILYLLIPVVYCASISMLFRPKRIISPIYIQVGAFSFMVFGLILKYSSSGVIDVVSLIGSIILLGFIGIPFAIEIGFFQLQIVRWLVGLNLESVDKKSFVIHDISPKDVKGGLGEEFFDFWHFRIKEEDELIRMTYKNNTKLSTILLLCKDPNDASSTILTILSFKIDTYAIIKTKKATELGEVIINDIKCKLEVNKKKKLEELKKIPDMISKKTLKEIDQFTDSKIGDAREFLRDIPLFYKIAIIFSIAAIIVFTVLRVFECIDNGTYVNAIIVFAIALVIEIGINLHGELTLRKKDR